MFYIYKADGFEAVEKATACKNDFGLDLFKYDGYVYEGRSGAKYISEAELQRLNDRLKDYGDVEKFNRQVDGIVAKIGLSPRYSRPDERKKDIFPPKEKDENIVFAKDAMGKKHYFFRFEYEGTEFFTLKNEKEYFRQVFVQCEGYMLGLDQHHRLAELKQWLDGLGEGGIKGEVEKRFNEQMADPRKWVYPGYANILGRADEAEAHNAPIREARKQENQRRDAEREAMERVAQQIRTDTYNHAVKKAEENIINKKTVDNVELYGKSLIMQLFREHNISVPLKTAGWIINSLQSVSYDENNNTWNYRYWKNSKGRSGGSTVFFELFHRLLAAVQTKQQFEEMTQNGEDTPETDSRIENEDENDMEI